jgi:hypothetical protein
MLPVISKTTRDARYEVMDVVKWVESRAKHWDQYKLIVEDKSTHDQRESECKILQVALQNLENLRVKHKIDVWLRDRQLENDMIEVDFMELRRRVTDRFPREHEAIRVYDMDDPTRSPHVIPGMCDFEVCQDYLIAPVPKPSRCTLLRATKC